MSRKILGIDIRQDSVSAVLMRSGIKSYWIESYVHVPFPDWKPEQDDSDEEAQELAIPPLAEALKAIVAKTDTGGAACVLAFPANQVCFRNMEMPFKDRKKIRQVLPFELEPTLPFAVDDLIMDFHTISDSVKAPETKHQAHIIAAASETAVLASHMADLASVGLEPETISVGGYASALCLAKFADIPEQCLFMDIDHADCTLFAIISGQICLIRAFPISSNEGKAESLCADAARTMTAFEENSLFDFHPDEIHITGYGSDLPGLEQEMERTLGIPVRRADLISATGAKVKPTPGTVMKTSAQMDHAFALGLAEAEGMMGLNLRRGPFAPKRQWQEHKKSFIHTGILLLMVLISGFSIMLSDLYSAEKKVTALRQQIEDIFKEAFPDKPLVQPVLQMQAALEELKKDMPQDAKRGIRAVDVFNEFSRRVPKDIDVEFTRLIIGPEKVQITANTDTFNSVDEIKNKLEEAAIFKEVVISNSKSDRTGNRVSFKLNIKLDV